MSVPEWMACEVCGGNYYLRHVGSFDGRVFTVCVYHSLWEAKHVIAEAAR